MGALLILPLLLMLLLPGQTAEIPHPGSPYESPWFLKGTIYSSDHKTPLFQFTRRSKSIEGRIEASRDFNYPNGKTAARETVEYNGDQLVSLTLQDFQAGARGSVRVLTTGSSDARILHFEYSDKTGAKLKQADESLRPDTLVTDMIPVFLTSHWDELVRGEELKCRLIVIPRRETVGFSFRAIAAKPDSAKTVTIRMSASSALIAALVDPVFFVMDKASPHHILEYSGRTTPRMRSGNSWKDLEALTVFDWASAKPQSSSKNPSHI